MIRNLRWIWIMLFYVFFCHIIIVNYFLQYFIILLHLIPSFLLTRSLLVPYTWVYIESIDYILLLPLELWAILLISSVKTLCLSLVNLCRGFKINFLFFTNSLWSFLRLPASVSFFFSRGFILFSNWVVCKQFFRLQVYDFFLWHFFVSFAFLSSLASSIR